MSNPNKQLSAFRRQIDSLDRDIIDLLGKRSRLSQQVGKFKKRAGLKPFDSRRWTTMLKNRMEYAKKVGVSHNLIREIYKRIHDDSLNIQEALLDK